jgi:hypothetical protein
LPLSTEARAGNLIRECVTIGSCARSFTTFGGVIPPMLLPSLRTPPASAKVSHEDECLLYKLEPSFSDVDPAKPDAQTCEEPGPLVPPRQPRKLPTPQTEARGGKHAGLFRRRT